MIFVKFVRENFISHLGAEYLGESLSNLRNLTTLILNIR
jgi:hypothetical protein